MAQVRPVVAGDALAIQTLVGATDAACVAALVAVENDTVIGYVSLLPLAVENGDDGRVYGIGTLGVAADYRRAGIDELLVEEAIGAAFALDARALVATGDARLLQPFGFRPLGDAGLADGAGGMVLSLTVEGTAGYAGKVSRAPAS
jgi:predicted N-acetyltransferase YhbS